MRTAGKNSDDDSKVPKGRAPYRLKRWTHIERDLRAERGPLLAGVDEVGRGPLAGPVVACAVIMPPDMKAIRGVDDSKMLTPAERVKLCARIQERALSFALGAASVREIERLNIYQASVLAMRRALGRLHVQPDHVIIDGKTMRTLPVAHTAIVHGDARCHSIACASIIAKVTRDRLMARLALRYPGYTWERNAGYTTKAHIRGLDSHGITPHHRRSFVRVSQLALDFGVPVADNEFIDAGGLDSAIVEETMIVADELGLMIALPADSLSLQA
ncbi:MAG TPA: ribonuclease HII [Gemmatimonadaceae bacterium]|nr:ribonuclease HII [Gemmatimonadaceae bacterium]